MSDITVKQAISVLKDAMKDDGYLVAWHANLAMAFYESVPEGIIDRCDLHICANEAAERFVKLFFDADSSCVNPYKSRNKEQLSDFYKRMSGRGSHYSDCATNNSPALTPSACNCYEVE